MNLYDIENRPMKEILQGYGRDKEKGFVCLECDYASKKEADLQKHWQEAHRSDQETRFIRLLNADSIVGGGGFSPLEKTIALHIFHGKKNSEIVEAMNGEVSINTIKTIRSKFVSLYNSAKLFLLMGQMMNLEKRPYKRQEPESDLIPGLDAPGGRVIGYFNKDQLHNRENPIPHATVLVLVAQREPSKAKGRPTWRFLVANKAGAIITLYNRVGKTGMIKLDTIGGHTGKDDGNVKTGEALPRNLSLGTAHREMLEETHIKNGSIDLSRLVYFYQSSYDGSIPAGWNIETSDVFLYVLEDAVKPANVFVREQYVDSLGGLVKARYPARFMTLEELYTLSESSYMDGLGRIVADLKQDPVLENKLYDLLEQAHGA